MSHARDAKWPENSCLVMASGNAYSKLRTVDTASVVWVRMVGVTLLVSLSNEEEGVSRHLVDGPQRGLAQRAAAPVAGVWAGERKA